MQQRQFITTMTRAVVVVVVIPCMASLSLAGEPASDRVAFVQIPAHADEVCGTEIDNTILASSYAIGSRLIITRWDEFDRHLQVVADGFAGVADPSFSYDGARLLFSGKKDSEQPFQIWELDGDESIPRQVVASDVDCISPVFMPNSHIVFASLLPGEYEEHGGFSSFSLYEQAPGADQPTRLTFNPSSDFDPVVLPDGRLAYSAWQHVGNLFWPRGIVSLMLVNSDGTGIFPLTGSHQGSWLKHGVAPFGDQKIAFIQTKQGGEFGAGALMAASLNDPFATYEILISTRTHLVEGVAPMPDGRFLVSARPLDGSHETFGLYVREPSGALTLLYDDPLFHDVSPSMGAPTERAEQRFSTVQPEVSHGYLLVLNCLETDRLESTARSLEDIQTVRLIEGLPLKRDDHSKPAFTSVEGREGEPLIHSGSATGYIPSRILGEVTPADDGSVYLKVPADRPLRMQLVDRDGFTIMNERSWFWVRPNERRVCIGCHENRELSPRNTVALAARSAPADLTDPQGWRTVTFRKDIEPIIEANCAKSGCHIPPRPTAAMNLDLYQRNGALDAPMTELYGPAYASLLARQEGKPFSIGGRRVHPGDARRSPLLWMLYGRTLAPQYSASPFERPLLNPHPDEPLMQAELDLIRTWIDLGAQYDESFWPLDSSWQSSQSARSEQGGSHAD